MFCCLPFLFLFSAALRRQVFKGISPGRRRKEKKQLKTKKLFIYYSVQNLSSIQFNRNV
jgi:hypothetical protein